MAKLIGNKTGVSGIYEPEDNVSLTRNLDDLSRYAYNNASNTSIFNLSSGISDLYISPDESKIYFTNTVTDRINQYNISGTNLTVDYFDLKNFSVTSQDTVPQDLFFKPDGTKVYIIGDTNNTIYQYSLSVAWDISTASYESKSFSVGTQEGTPASLFFKDDGLKVYIVGTTNRTIYQYSLSVAWDISTASYESKSFSVGAQDLTPLGLFFKDDGLKVYIIAVSSNRIYQYALGTAWDISTASYESKSFLVSSQESFSNGLFFKNDGLKVYIVGQTNDTIYQYSLSVAWDISTASYTNKSFPVSSQETVPTGLFFKPDGTKVYIIGSTNDRIYQYSLSVAWDISTINIVPSYFVGNLDGNVHSISFKSDGTVAYILGQDTDRVIQLPLTTPWNIETAPVLNSFFVGTQDTVPTDLFFKPDGLKVYIIGDTNNTIYQYSLGTAWDISTASYESKSFSVGTQDIVPNDLFFKDDGLKVYIIGDTNNTIYQYSLSVAWDISTASYDTKSFAVTTQENLPQALFFKDDGLKVYILGQQNDRIYQYSLSVAWDISTASYDNKSFLISGQETTPTGVFFKSDGTKVYIIGSTNDTIYQYSLGTAWDVSTASYDSKSFYTVIGNSESLPNGLFFKSDGTKVYTVGQNTDAIYEYSLSTAWDITTSPIHSFSIASQENTPTGLFFKDDGTRFYIVGTNNDTIYQYSLTTAWNLSTASYDSKSFFVGIQEILPTGLFFKPDGTKVYIVGQVNDRVYIFNLTTPWDISTTVNPYNIKSFSVGSQETASNDLFFKPDGTKVYIIGTTNDRIYQYSLGTAWDVSTASYDSKSFLVSGQETTPFGLFFKPDGAKVYIIGTTNRTIYQYSLSTPWDISTASYDSKSFLVSGQESTPGALFFKDDGLKVYIMGQSSDTIYEYSLSVAWDISTAFYTNNSFLVSSQETTPNGLYFKDDGTEFYILGLTTDTIYEYSLSIAWDISTASYANKSFFVGSQEGNPTGLFLKPDGTKVYIIGSTGNTIFQYDLEVPWNFIPPIKSLLVSVQDTAPAGIALSNDLSKLYMVGSNNRALHQYDLIN